MSHRVKQTDIMLHACCAPCSLEPVRVLRDRAYTPTIFYSNSNIHPNSEYERRLSTLKQWCESERLETFIDTYDVDDWEGTVGALGDDIHETYGTITCFVDDEKAQTARSTRCRACYRLRFTRAAEYAAHNNFTLLGTTLSVSPYQYTSIIDEELKHACDQADIQALFEDYRPLYPAATSRSKELGMYRQNYCGCRFSALEADAERAVRAAQRAVEKLQKEQACAARQEVDAARKAARLEHAEKQARKREIAKRLRSC